MRWIRHITPYLLVGVMATLAFTSYSIRYRLTADAWHWTHNDTVRFGNYLLTIPVDWFVAEAPSSGLDIADAGFASRVRSSSRISWIKALLTPGSLRAGIEGWQSSQRMEFELKGAKNIEQNTIQHENELLACVGADVSNTRKTSAADFLMLCESAGGGRIRFIFEGYREDLPSFYRFIGQIRGAT